MLSLAHLTPVDEELEFEESELYNNEPAPVAGSERHSGSEESGSDDDVELEDAAPPGAVDVLPELDDGSAQSSTLRVSLEQPDDDEVANHPLRRPVARPIAQSLPAQQQVRMGTSVPIGIPMMSRWKQNDAEPIGDAQPAAPEPVYPATFVPPHQLSQNAQFMFSLTGESPGFVLKKERLRARTAILRSTGFLESEIARAASGGLPAAQAARPVVAGGLSQALHGANTAHATAH